jgi:hypothetical protein
MPNAIVSGACLQLVARSVLRKYTHFALMKFMKVCGAMKPCASDMAGASSKISRYLAFGKCSTLCPAA